MTSRAPRLHRDPAPAPGVVAAAYAGLVIAGRPARGCPDPAAAVAAVAAQLRLLWPETPPEAVRDALTETAVTAAAAGIVVVPAPVTGVYDAGVLAVADGMLTMAAAWIGAGKPEPRPGRPTPVRAFASSVAFDRDADAETLTGLAVLLVLAESAA